MVTVPVRPAPVFWAIESPMFVGPVPLVPDAIVTHAALLDVDQVQAGPMLNCTTCVLGAAATSNVDGVTVAAQFGAGAGPGLGAGAGSGATDAAAWVTTNVRPPSVMAPSRAAPSFADTW